MSSLLLEHATRTMAVGSKSFATAATLFDVATRRSVLMLYTWCRHCDDVIDNQSLGFNLTPSPGVSAQERLAGLRTATQRAYDGELMQDPAFAAFQEVALTHDIPPRLAFEHLDGFAMDVAATPYVTLEDTLSYCYHVAGVVGLMMAHIMGVREKQALDRACDLGLAFQLTNIARDIVDDAQVGRCYLPTQWLDNEGLTLTDFTAPENRASLARIARRLLNAAAPYYDSALAGLSALPVRSAWAVGTAHSVYREIGVKLKAAGAQAWDRRQRTSTREKVVMLMGAGAQVVMSRTMKMPARPPWLWQRPMS